MTSAISGSASAKVAEKKESRSFAAVFGLKDIAFSRRRMSGAERGLERAAGGVVDSIPAETGQAVGISGAFRRNMWGLCLAATAPSACRRRACPGDPDQDGTLPSQARWPGQARP